MNGLLRMLKIDPTEKCDERRVVLEVKQKDNTWKRLVGQYKCAHVAGGAVLQAIATANSLVLVGLLDEKDVPKLSEFRFAYVDDIGVEAEVEDTSLAKTILDQFRSKQ